ncbi:MAG: nuclear transport factor 2 family protein [Eubacteriales bacterium]|nr:nuclear transport factor 2 family protein [Eubacteriales bacterium]
MKEDYDQIKSLFQNVMENTEAIWAPDKMEIDYIHIYTCGSVIRICENRGAQSAEITGVASSEKDGFRACQFAGICVAEYEKRKNKWETISVKMDITHAEGNFKSFIEKLPVHEQSLGWHKKIRLPAVSGELDSPFGKIPSAEEGLTEQEKILQSFYRYIFGIDTASFENVSQVLAENVMVIMEPFGMMDKRTFLQTIKLQRMTERFWIHPVLPEKVQVTKDEAKAYFLRLMGHGKRWLQFAPDNVKNVPVCGSYDVDFKRQGGEWKIIRMEYIYLGEEG